MPEQSPRRVRYYAIAERCFKAMAQPGRVWVPFFVLGLPVFLLVVGISFTLNHKAAAEQAAINDALRQEIRRLEQQNNDARAVLANEDPESFCDYVLRVARERLGLALPGDQIFIDRSVVPSEAP